ncbi:hypothetical protein PROVRETT_08072 [Providencia rettgeri DSM 1131]|nr:hypothetical protein PROVRETT_08072 [Providencia rettgeri DSM 1131]
MFITEPVFTGFFLFFRHISHCRVVGFVQLLGSHTYVCSPRYLLSPPSYSANYLEKIVQLKAKILFCY